MELALVLGKQVKDLEASDLKGALDAIESVSYPIFSFPPSIILIWELDRLRSEHRHDRS